MGAFDQSDSPPKRFRQLVKKYTFLNELRDRQLARSTAVTAVGNARGANEEGEIPLAAIWRLAMAAYSPWPGLSATSTSEELAVNGDAPMYSRSPVKLGVMAASPFSAPPAGQFLMLKRYSDHAANERTFLAWVRTSIAVMAFGS
jgi:hypothetical protein